MLLFDSFGVEGVLNGIFPVLHLSEISLRTIIEYITLNYKKNSYNYLPNSAHTYYQGQCYVYGGEEIFDEKNWYIDKIKNPKQPISDFCIHYLYKIIDFCKNNNINLYFFVPPMPDKELINDGNYQHFVDYVDKIANENKIKYFDFNLIKKDYLELDETCFLDHGHLNGKGGDLFSQCLYRFLSGKMKFPFYDTYEEKVKFNLNYHW